MLLQADLPECVGVEQDSYTCRTIFPFLHFLLCPLAYPRDRTDGVERRHGLSAVEIRSKLENEFS